MKTNEKARLSVTIEEPRRASVVTVSEAGSEYALRRKIKYGGPLSGSCCVYKVMRKVSN